MKLILCLTLSFFSLQATLQQYTYGRGTLKRGAPYPSLECAQLFGERCSGTNFFTALFNNNFTISISGPFGHKHFPCWFEYPYDEEFYKRPIHEYILEGSDNVLFLIIFRNPYDWLQSLHNKPYHTRLWRATFSDFIRSPWLIKSQFNGWLSALDSDPETKLPFKNVLKLRSAKIKNMLKLQDLVKNAYYISYETLYAHPQEVLQEIHEVFGLPLNEIFTPILHHFVGGKNKEIPFKKTQYPPIFFEDRDFINENLDAELEYSIGYILYQENL